MSQVFAGDAVNAPAGGTIATSTETPVAAGNFLNPPFGNAKAYVSASASFTTGTGATSVTLRLRRNPNAENVVVASSGAINVTATNQVQMGLQAADAIPDGRSCQYQLTVQQAGAGGTGSVAFASIGALLISG